MGWLDDMAVDVPEGVSGDVKIERFTIEKGDLENLRLAFNGRGCQPGTYTRLLRGNSLWMSDTTAERRDHIEPAMMIRQGAPRVLIGGLGLGMILRVALLESSVEHIDVVELDPDVIALVGPHYEKMAADRGVQLVIHRADMYEIKWPPKTRWDVAWFDIWGDVSTDTLSLMARLNRSYGRRTGWCRCWAQDWLQAQKRRERESGWW